MTDCSHRWLIATPNGPTSEGVCSDCGEVRKDFSNVMQYHTWSRAKKSTALPKRQA